MDKKVKEVVAFMKEKGVTMNDLRNYFDGKSRAKFSLVIDDVYDIRGTVVSGRVDEGRLYVGMELSLVKGTKVINCKCVAIEKYRKLLNVCLKGDYVAIKLEGVSRRDVKKGMTLISVDKESEE